ncbi:acetyl-CoA carboxylase carboxyltransferase [Burkholderia pseudomallei]|uniref:acyl-CoA carboxylase subunit beta n=1 Tax=Burkholderia pseudomallei TaxID=28450 RepID=UPI000977F4B7|nr:acyl-CoA carboxylase subunit beta [Burkholderia pseudomallei]MBF3432706.1 acyl-CoA carboxylase subunit beta [Burkholderia pseudomallei]MBF3723254.1 acyl-CoA carboxylase subunit beta [Burkholderia pseudomallei]MBF3733732.1 acyl-CoA carboxylase subunit beta [Burkholderia pseudomallei]OMT77196.1 acetyl-CoA carboxylase carboxyltransferase subunit [Burkholderia pseudomallei]CAJ4346267.1 acetyl-CoA carboxylase carboxyltransferase [Burkholderia pseudomallei]
MPTFDSRLDTASAAFRDNAEHMRALIAQWHALNARAADESAKAGPRFDKRGQLLPRERLALLVDAGAPFLELASLAGYLVGESDPDQSVPGAGLIGGIGYVSGTRCMIVVADSGIDAGALQPMGLEKFQRLQRIALEHQLPFVHLVESAGANLMQYRVEEFIHGGRHFFQLAKLSAAGIPVFTLVHGSSTAGGAYMPGLSDYVVMVRDRAKAFLAGPPLLKAATGEIATDEELGGAAMHASVSGLAEYVADDDADGIRILRELVDKLGWREREAALPTGAEPALDPEGLLGILPRDGKKPVDMREVIARLVDASDLLEFQPAYGPATVCVHARIHGMPVGIVTNNGPLDPAGATKATHFIQACCQSDVPLVYLQNTTGFIVGKASERAGMIKHGAKMIQAVSNATVPQITILCGASFGAGNYGMCGRGFDPAFVFSWPNARTAVMGAEQAALTMAIVMEGAARAKGIEPERARIDALREKIVANFERQTHAFYTSGRMLDDGVIDPRDTRRVLAITLAVCRDGRRKSLQPLTFGVARP